MTILQRFKKTVIPGLFTNVGQEYRAEFERENARINFDRSKILAVLLMIIHIPLTYRDIAVLKVEGYWEATPGYKYLFYLHVFLITAMTLYLAGAFIISRMAAGTNVKRYTSYAFAVVVLAWAAILAAYVANPINSQITEYIIGMLGIAAAFHLTPRAATGIIVGGQVIFLATLIYTADDPNANGYVTNTIALACIAWTVSQALFSAHARNFTNRKTIEEQNATLGIANEKLEQRNAELKRLNAEKSELMGIVAHDLKNPLSAIVLSFGNIRRYAQRMTPDDLDQRYASVEASTRQMLGLINDLLEDNALDSGAYNLKPGSFSMREFMENVLENFAEAAQRKNIRLQLEPIAKDFTVTTDAKRLEQVLHNLVSNALKFSAPDTQVVLGASEVGDEIQMYVRDQGPGICQEDLQKLYQRFARLSSRPTGGEHSSGLGLSIVKKVVELLHGNISCSSAVGVGTTFIVQIPRELPPLQENPVSSLLKE